MEHSGESAGQVMNNYSTIFFALKSQRAIKKETIQRRASMIIVPTGARYPFPVYEYRKLSIIHASGFQSESVYQIPLRAVSG
jgi:hypothetical protein